MRVAGTVIHHLRPNFSTKLLRSFDLMTFKWPRSLFTYFVYFCCEVWSELWL